MELLERSTSLDTLAAYAAEAADGNGRLVLVSGESGIGKTALVEAFQAQLHGARWLWGACDGLLTPRPLGPLFDIAVQTGGRLAQLCGDGATRDQLFDAFLAELECLPLTVAVIEDVHWADESTIDLLKFVGRRLSRMKALILVTLRDDEAGHDALVMLLGDLATERATRRIGLPPLSGEAVRLLVGQHDLDSAELWRATGGNPFLVCEAIEGGWPAVPPTVRDVVAARLARSSAAVREALQTAAVIGSTIDRNLLASVLDEPMEILDRCLATGLLTAEAGSLRFRHDLVRTAIAQSVSTHRTRQLHGQLLAALESAGDTDPAILAHHSEGAGDAAATVRHALAAAIRSADLGAHREAAAQYERALRHADAADLQTLAELKEGLADEHLLLDRLDESEAALHVALGYRRELHDDVNLGRDLSVLSDVLCYQCRGEESAQAAAESLAVLQPLPPGPELAVAHLGVAASMADVGRHAEAQNHIAKALSFAERLGRKDLVCAALITKGMCAIHSGQDGIGFLEQALRLALEAGDEHNACNAYMCLQDACLSLQRLDEAEVYFKAGMAIGERRELRGTTRCLRVEHADTLLLQGNWDEAAAVCTEVLTIPGVSPWNQLYPLRILGTIRGRRGEPGHAELLDASAAMSAGAMKVPWTTQVRAARAELLWLAGEGEAACAEARLAYDEAVGQTDLWRLGSVAIWAWRLGAAVDVPTTLPEPYALEMAGDWRSAVAAWERLGRTYDAAVTRIFACSEDSELRTAVVVLDNLGARATAAAARRQMKALGMTAIPRGPRATTRAAPGGLTAREQEVLALLSLGLPDKEISRRLVISERTVHHHVSSILAKTGAPTRGVAARQAAGLGVGSPR
jgi:DNA-binding CsgD family transcriptional regulator/tetratricopeptide (TPR) repeat protein